MPIIPKIKSLPSGDSKYCHKCGLELPVENFTSTRSLFYSDSKLPFCNSCITTYLTSQNFSWPVISKLCQWADLPFIVKEWERLFELNGPVTAWSAYSKTFETQAYEDLGWADYENQYKNLKALGYIDREIPLFDAAQLRELARKWGSSYTDEELYYLEELYKGLMTSQNVNGSLQIDQAQKLCKISLEIDNRIRSGDKDVDKFLSSYDKLIKTAEFTPKNAKNATDFDSIAELAVWMEKKGIVNKFYDGATRDVIDETLKNIEAYNRRLYINESGMGESITQRIEALKIVDERDRAGNYNLGQDYDEDKYDNNGFTFEIEEDEEEFSL